VPRTSTFALTNATLPWTERLARLGTARALRESPELASSANVLGGRLVYPAVGEAFDLPWTPVDEALGALA
jgi:alanine dehydrogenase